MSSAALPEFGQADLSNCEREQIHLAASIQPHGALLAIRADGVVVQSSANARSYVGLRHDPNGAHCGELGGDLPERIGALLDSGPLKSPLIMRCKAGPNGEPFDMLAHTPPEEGLIVELERVQPAPDPAASLENALSAIIAAPSLRVLCEESAEIFKALTGYDRVMVYRFDEEGHGEVFSERREPALEAFLGNRYPASDIPQIARRLYERTRVRVLVDVNCEPVPLTPRLSPFTGRDLDMSLCFLRNMSPIHVQYLKNMGVRATLVISLVVGGKLWGLVACHHYVPRNVSFEIRAACELLAEAVATRVAALESFAESQAGISVRRLEQRMIEAISQNGDWRVALFDNSQALLQPLGASGAALLFENQVLTAGEVPGTHDLREIGEWLDDQPRQPVTATASLAIDEPRFTPMISVASGIVAAPVSATRGEYLVWFRPERIRMVTWGGDPLEPVLIGNDPSDLSPRRSFAKWHQLVERRSEPWSPADLAAAKLIGETVSDVVLQFRSVRMLIAQDQLTHFTHQVRNSEVPVVICDARGRILLGNESFEALVSGRHPHLEWAEDLAQLFCDQQDARRRLRDLVGLRRTWRGEMKMKAADGTDHAVLVRGDPVFSSPDRVLGIVLLFNDIAERKAAEAASVRFQEDFIEKLRLDSFVFEGKTDALYQRLLSSLVENAQLAALEIRDGVDNSRVIRMLEGVHEAVTRAAKVLDDLIRHSGKNTPGRD